MKIWNAPVMQELDVKLTAKMPSTSEEDIRYSENCGWLAATYNSATAS